LHDIALLTGGKTIAKDIEFQLSVLQISDLGQARRITVDKSHTCIDTSRSEDPKQRLPRGVGPLLAFD
jgi:chaperonin GroEL (HSP60 family)